MLARRILRILAPARPEDFLNDDELETFKLQALTIDKASWVGGALIFGVLALGLGFAAHWIWHNLSGAAVDPVIDTRSPLLAIIAAMLAALALSLVGQRYFLQQKFGSNSLAMYDRFSATRSGLNQRRLTRVAALIFSVGCVIILSFSFEGVVVDANGIRFDRWGFLPERRAFTQVRTVVLAAGHVRSGRGATAQQVGAADAVLHVDFDSGAPLIIRSAGRDTMPDVLQRVARHISGRSGVPVQREMEFGK